ncbi:hypothetical protein [Bordetella sp. 15P40C-2]|uniref:hypothetical protein n=1 Tax=Bordetella sp. 15P40C-2 TaxID=2572246 RepID=UPI001329F1BB|nr:hypothetical protein [Bordetella sp. 15P40C-2]MVW72310.1 hypothetical protein [Bordetella sp. 15P40C-2]
MSTATLTSDSDLAVPSRLSIWAPARLVQMVATGLRRPVRWPFSAGRGRAHSVCMPPAAAPQSLEIPQADSAPTSDAPATGEAVHTTPASTGHAHIAGHAKAEAIHLEGLALHSQSLGTAYACQPALSLRQKVVDILLVAVWGALIPGLMWLGAAAGF